MNRKVFLFFAFITLIMTPFRINALSNNELLKEIRKYLPYLRDSSCGAIDAVGNYTKDSGNGLGCSGFAKWVVDGFYYPLTEGSLERYISLKAVREKHLEERGDEYSLKYENLRDPFFGLDWTRNLAVQLGIKRGEQTFYKKYDVIDSSIVAYVTDCGYPLEKIEEVLKEQEIMHPGRIYLGSINGMYGSNPKLWQHYHVVVFIPYYEDDELKIAVLERNKETSFPYLLKRYEDTFCHLVAIPIEGKFKLMKP